MTLYRLPFPSVKPTEVSAVSLRHRYDHAVELTRPDVVPPLNLRNVSRETPLMFAEGGEVGYEDEDPNLYNEYPERKDRNTFDPVSGVWRDSATGNTFNPAEGIWHDPRGYDYIGGQWVPPAQTYDPNTAASAPQSVEPSLRDSLVGQLQAGTITPNAAEQQWNQYSGASALAQQDLNRQALADAGVDSYQNLRERGIGEGSIRGDLGDTALGRGANWFVGQGIAPLENFRDYTMDTLRQGLSVGAPTPSGRMLAMETPWGEAAAQTANALIPTTPLGVALTVGPGALGFRAGLQAGEGVPSALVRGIAEGVLTDPTTPGGLTRLGAGEAIPRLGTAEREGLQMLRQAIPGSVTGERGASSLRLAGGADDLPSIAGLGDLSRRNISDLRAIAADRGIDLGDATRKADIIDALRAGDTPRIPAGGEPTREALAGAQRAADAVPDSEIEALREGLRPDLEPPRLTPDQDEAIRALDQGSTSVWPEMRKEFEGQWPAWEAWRDALPPAERVARGRDWMELLDATFAAPNQETRLALENVGLDKMRAEMAKSLINDAIKTAPTMTPADFTAKIVAIESYLDRLALAQAKMAEDAWRLLPGGYKAGEPGARWSRQAADHWVGDARQGVEPEKLRALAGASDKMSKAQLALDILNIPRAGMAGADFSPIGTHMAPLIVAHPEHIGALRAAAAVMFDERAFDDLMQQYNRGSKWAQYDIDLHLPSMAGANREGQILPSEIVAKLPVYRETGRFTTAGLAGVRSDEVDRFITKLEKMPKWSEVKVDDAGVEKRVLNAAGKVQAQKYARSVESLTGRANLGGLQNLDRYLSGVFFSPSYTLSQVQRFAPLLDTPFTPVWNETARNLGAYVATGMGLLAAAAYAGASVSTEPGANFGKITTPGGHHINIWGGQQALARLIYQEATGKSVSEAGSTYKADRGALPLAYGVNRLSPQASILLRSVPESVRNQIGDKDLQRALWPEGRADLPGSLYRFATNPSKETRDKALSAVGQFFVPLWVQDAVDGFNMDGIKGALVAGGLNIVGAQDMPYAPSAFTRQTREYEGVKDAVPFGETWAGLARGDKFVDLSTREKELVRQTAPEVFDRLINQGAESARRKGDEYQKAIDTQTAIRATYAPVFPQLEERLKAGQLSPYEARKAVELAEDQMQKELNGVKFPEFGSSREKSEIQVLIDTYNSIYDRTQRPDGSVDWEGRAQLQQAMLNNIRETKGQEWADRLQFNVEARVNAKDPAILQLHDAAKPLVSQYNSIPLGAPDNPNRYAQREAWLVEQPKENAMLFYLGRVSELRTPAAVETLAGFAPGVNPVIDFYTGFNQKGSVDRTVRDAAANVYYNLPGDVNRQTWRREHPQEDAILWRSGYVPNLVSLQAWELAGKP